MDPKKQPPRNRSDAGQDEDVPNPSGNADIDRKGGPGQAEGYVQNEGLAKPGGRGAADSVDGMPGSKLREAEQAGQRGRAV